MKFYNREKELAILKQLRTRSLDSAQMTILVGRRRIGKTRLILESLKNEPFLYFFVAKKEEALLCSEFVEIIQKQLQIPIFGTITKFSDLYELLMQYAENQPINVVIDEFQEFQRINASVYSDMQRIWDLHKEKSKMNLILSGSVYSLMKQIFEHNKEPLFGRVNQKIHVKAFPTTTLKEIFADSKRAFTNLDLLAFYMLSGGIPKYVEIFADKNRFTFEELLDEVLSDYSLFLEEGRNVLIGEFGKEYTTYFSILTLIASSKTSRTAIESVLQKDVGGYLSRLEKEYEIIQRVRPIFSKPNSRSVKYFIEDNFLAFWFRFLYKNKAAVEMGNFAYLRTLIEKDWSSFSGRFLEKYFRQQLAQTGKYNQIGSYWESKSQNEIDIVAVNEAEKTALIGEVKLNKNQYNKAKLIDKAYSLQRVLSGYKVEYRGFSLEDM